MHFISILSNPKRTLREARKEMRERHISKILTVARRRYGMWETIASHASDTEITVDSKRRYRRYCINAAWAINREDRQQVVYSQIVGVYINLVFFGTVIYAVTYSHSTVFTLSFMASILATGTLLTLLVVLARGRALAMLLGAGAIGVSGWTIAIASQNRILPSPHSHPLSSGIAYGVYMIPAMLIFSIATAALSLYMLRWQINHARLNKYPDVVAVAELQMLIDALTSSSSRIDTWKERNEFYGRLERTARCLELGFPNVNSMPDAHASSVFQQRMIGAAAYIRSLHLWRALPRNDTRALLLETLSRTCVVLSDGHYDMLPSLQASPAEKRHYLLAVVKSTKVLMVGILPICLLWLTRRFGIMPSGHLQSSLAVASILWAVVTLMMAIDPLFTGKLSALKEVLALLRGGDGKM